MHTTINRSGFDFLHVHDWPVVTYNRFRQTLAMTEDDPRRQDLCPWCNGFGGMRMYLPDVCPGCRGACLVSPRQQLFLMGRLYARLDNVIYPDWPTWTSWSGPILGYKGGQWNSYDPVMAARGWLVQLAFDEERRRKYPGTEARIYLPPKNVVELLKKLKVPESYFLPKEKGGIEACKRIPLVLPEYKPIKYSVKAKGDIDVYALKSGKVKSIVVENEGERVVVYGNCFVGDRGREGSGSDGLGEKSGIVDENSEVWGEDSEIVEGNSGIWGINSAVDELNRSMFDECSSVYEEESSFFGEDSSSFGGNGGVVGITGKNIGFTGKNIGFTGKNIGFTGKNIGFTAEDIGIIGKKTGFTAEDIEVIGENTGISAEDTGLGGSFTFSSLCEARLKVEELKQTRDLEDKKSRIEAALKILRKERHQQLKTLNDANLSQKQLREQEVGLMKCQEKIVALEHDLAAVTERMSKLPAFGTVTEVVQHYGGAKKNVAEMSVGQIRFTQIRSFVAKRVNDVFEVNQRGVELSGQVVGDEKWILGSDDYIVGMCLAKDESIFTPENAIKLNSTVKILPLHELY